jgi:hypothetical protein
MAKPETFKDLTTEYEDWCAEQGIECVDAMELIIKLSDQRKWVSAFIRRWDAIEEPVQITYQSGILWFPDGTTINASDEVKLLVTSWAGQA